MPDTYTPALATFSWSAVESEAIRVALLHDDPWNHDALELRHIRKTLRDIKKRILDFHLARQGQTCCYCRTNLNGGGHFLIDREHILPKSKFRELTYTISNLSVSCKRCNMQLKHDDLRFVKNTLTIKESHDDGDQYLFAHPNFDNLDSLIKRFTHQDGRKVVVTFLVSDHPKACFTYEYFDLRGLEVNSFDLSQGAQKMDDVEIEVSKLLSIEIEAAQQNDP